MKEFIWAPKNALGKQNYKIQKTILGNKPFGHEINESILFSKNFEYRLGIQIIK